MPEKPQSKKMSDEGRNDAAKEAQPSSMKTAREARLAKALRANLRRRKASDAKDTNEGKT
ncbi:MAG: hypothetical protein AAGD92_15115 [Pseudomonadota bacterium]